MNDLIEELKKRNVEFKVLSDGAIDCEDTVKLESIDCLAKYKRYPIIDDFEKGTFRYRIEK